MALTMTKLDWQKALRISNLTPTEYMVLMMISTYTDARGCNAYPGWARLTADTNLDVRTIKRAVKSTIAKGYLILSEAGGNHVFKGAANVYEITLPAGHPARGASSVPLALTEDSLSTQGGLSEDEAARGTSGAPRGSFDDTQGGHSVSPHQVIASGHLHQLHDQSEIDPKSKACTSRFAPPAPSSPSAHQREPVDNPGPFTIKQRSQLVTDIVAVALAVEDHGQWSDERYALSDALAERIEEFFDDGELMAGFILNDEWTIHPRCIDRYEAGKELNKLINTAGVGHLRPEGDPAA